MQEILKSIKAFLYERTVSPLLGAFVTAWLVWNYRVVLVLLNGNASLTAKLGFLDEYFGDDHLFEVIGFSFHVIGGGHFVHGILMPAIVTWVYLYLYPILAKPVYEHSLDVQKELKGIKQKIENARLLSVEESRNLQKEIEQLRYKADEEVSSYRARIASLTETINTLEEELRSNKSEAVRKADTPLDSSLLNGTPLSEDIVAKVSALDDGKFEFSDLFGSQWNSFSIPSKQEYGKQFRKSVERGDFPDVQLVKKGSGNQLIYEKNTTAAERASFQNWLEKKFPPDSFTPNAFANEIERIDLLKKIANYFSRNKLGEDAFNFLLNLVKENGQINLDQVVSLFESKLSAIEIDHLINELKEMGLIKEIGPQYFLADRGKKLAVDSGLTALVKKLAREFSLKNL